MSRPLRIEFSGALYHVMSCGNERRDIVDWLRRTVETYRWRLHAFVLMTNHDHLFVETPEPNLSAGMQYLNGSYTSYFNRRHSRAGHLFQGRFKDHFGTDADKWQPGSRHDDASRAVAAYLARREFGYPPKDIAQTLGYRSHGSVRNAMLRVEANNDLLQHDVRKLKATLAVD